MPFEISTNFYGNVAANPAFATDKYPVTLLLDKYVRPNIMLRNI